MPETVNKFLMQRVSASFGAKVWRR